MASQQYPITIPTSADFIFWLQVAMGLMRGLVMLRQWLCRGTHCDKLEPGIAPHSQGTQASYAVLRCAALCCAVLCCAVLRCAVLCCAVL